MSNGLLSGGGGFDGWDTTPIQNENNNNNNNNNNNSKLKPYKNQKRESESSSNPFLSSDPLFNTAPTDNAYINPFIDTKQEENNKNNHINQPSMNSIQENQTLDPQVFDLLFDTNNVKDNSNQNNSNNTNDAFYAFDFGINDNNDNNKNNNNKMKLNGNKKDDDDESTSNDDDDDDEDDDDSDDSSDDDDEDEDEEEEGNKNKNKNKKKKIDCDDLKLSPPKKKATRSKKKRINSNNLNSNKTENERAFELLHKQFDPSLIGKFPINEIDTKSLEKQEIASKQKGKRHTEPINVHSRRQKQLQKEGLISNDIQLQSPNIGTSLRTKKGGKQRAESEEKKEEKEKEKPPKKGNYNVLPELHRGTALLKYGRRGYPHFRQFNLTADNENLRWFSSKKKLQQSSINVGSINEILTGQHTKEFRRIAWTTLTPASFSIIYENKKKSLNLVAKSVDEMKMWVQALRKLRDLKKRGENLSRIEKLPVEVDFRDRNRPQSRNHSGNFLRSHETKERAVDPILQRKLIDDISNLRKQFIEISREANNPIIQSTKEYESIEQILSELEERIEELDHEIRNTRNTKIAENDVWRTRIDLESLREKIKVINKQKKTQYKNSKRRWSVF